MGLHYEMVVKNTFIHCVDQKDEADVPRSRALSEFTGMCQAKEQQVAAINRTDCVPFPENEIGQYGDYRTTIMMRNIPNVYSPQMLVELLEYKGFHCRFDFAYLPIDFRSGVNLGYAFVNLLTNNDANEFIEFFHGFCDWACESMKLCEVSWAHPHQGLEAHVERYRNSPVMHENMPDEYKPRLYQDGVRIAFPEPTKRIRAPRVRPQRRS
jgi:hypothetical protein